MPFENRDHFTSSFQSGCLYFYMSNCAAYKHQYIFLRNLEWCFSFVSDLKAKLSVFHYEGLLFVEFVLVVWFGFGRYPSLIRDVSFFSWVVLCFSHENVLDFVKKKKTFYIFWDDHKWCSFILLKYYILLVNLQMLNQTCIIRINHNRWWSIIHFLYCWLQIVVRSFASIVIRSFLFVTYVLFCYQNNINLINLFESVSLSSIFEKSLKDWYWFSFNLW